MINTMFQIKQFSDDLFKLRFERNMTANQVYEKSGVNPTTIYNFERGMVKDPSITSVIKLCKWMGKDITAYIN